MCAFELFLLLVFQFERLFINSWVATSYTITFSIFRFSVVYAASKCHKRSNSNENYKSASGKNCYEQFRKVKTKSCFESIKQAGLIEKFIRRNARCSLRLLFEIIFDRCTLDMIPFSYVSSVVFLRLRSSECSNWQSHLCDTSVSNRVV